MRYYLIAGEASGDLHGSFLIKAIKDEDPKAEFRAWGGDLMQAQGAILAMHYKSIAIMGFVDVLKSLPKIFKNLALCKKDITAFNPHAVIFIDFSGFNLRIAPWAKVNGYTTHYYIAPQLWASRAKRVRKIKASIDHLYVTLPFEPDFYKAHSYPAHFVGHPLLDAMESIEKPASNWRVSHGLDPVRPIIALLPGSRKQEIKAILPEMVAICHSFKEYQFIMAAAPSIDTNFYTAFIGTAPIKKLTQETYALLQESSAALVASGTATLETALIGIPQVVCYKTQWLTYAIAKQIIKLPYISLVNLILDKEAVTELIQKELNTKTLKNALTAILSGPNRAQQLKDYLILKEKLGAGGASKRAAALIVKNTFT